MTIVTLGIGLGKNLNSIVGLDVEGRVVLRRRVRRATLAELAGKLPPCTVAMEACCGAHHVGRLFAAQGREVRLMSPEYVRPYVRAQKNDESDAAGIAEAATRPTMRFVELKSQDRLDLQTLHRARSRLVAARKTLVNQLRAILLERGYVFRQGRKVLERDIDPFLRSEEHTSEVQSIMRISYAVFCLTKKKKKNIQNLNEINIITSHKTIFHPQDHKIYKNYKYQHK